jgi:hypothetical protein
VTAVATEHSIGPRRFSATRAEGGEQETPPGISINSVLPTCRAVAQDLEMRGTTDPLDRFDMAAVWSSPQPLKVELDSFNRTAQG